MSKDDFTPLDDFPVWPDNHLFAQIVRVSGPDVGEVVDFPKYIGIDQSRVAIQRRKEKRNERRWTTELMAAYDEWREAVDLAPAIRIETERSIGVISGINPRAIGCPRMDSLVTHPDGSVSIIEVKVQSGVNDPMSALGQLLHYRVAIERMEKKTVAALVLATPYLPPLVLDVIANFRLPIRVLKARSEMFSGIVPDHVARTSADH